MSQEQQYNQAFREALQNDLAFKRKIAGFFKSLSSALRIMPLYPAAHPMVKSAIEKAYEELSGFLLNFGDLSLDIMDNNVVLYGELLEDSADVAKNIIANIKKFHVQGLLIEKGISLEEMEKFLGLLGQKIDNAEKQGGIKQQISNAQIQHINIVEVRYARITEDEEVARKDGTEKSDSGGGSGLGEGAGGGPKDIVGMVSDFFGGQSDVVPDKETIALEFKKHTKKLVKQLLKLVGPEKAVEEVIKIIKDKFDLAGFTDEEQQPYLEKVETETIRLRQPKVTRKQLEQHLNKLLQENKALKQELNNIETMVELKVQQATETLIVENQRIKKEKERINSVLRNVAEGLVIVDNDGKVMTLNPAAEKLLGVDKSSKIGSNILEGLKDEHVVSMSKYKQQNIEIELTGNNENTKKTVRASTAMIENEDGQTIGMVSVLSDITKQKELDQMKDTFVSNVSHELRAPLISIQKSLGLILDTVDQDKMDPQQRQFLQVASNNATRLTELVNDLLDMAKLEAGGMIVDYKHVSAESVLAGVSDILGAWSESRGVSIKQEVHQGLELDADPKLLNQVFTNLVGNAIKFTKSGGVVILSAEAIDDRIKFCVADTGCGIPADSLGTIFGKFEQSRIVPIEGAPKGTGLGLSIVKEIVELHGGKIWVESEEGSGSQFYFELPKVQEILDIRD